MLAWGAGVDQRQPLAMMFTTAPDWWATVARPPVFGAHAGPVVAGDGTAVSEQQGVFFDILTGRWGTMRPQPRREAGDTAAAAVWAGGHLVLWSGEVPARDRARTQLWRPSMPWRPVAPAPVPLTGDVSALWTGWLRDQQQILLWNNIGAPPHNGAAYRPAGQAWETLPKPPISPRARPAAAWTGDELLVLGGRASPSGDLLRDGVAYDPLLRTWRSLPQAPFSLSGRAAAWGGDALYAAGRRGGDALVGRFDPALDAWEPLPPPPLDGGFAAEYAVYWTGFEVWIWRVDSAGEGAGAAWDPRQRVWRNLPTSPPWFDTGTAVAAGRRMFLVNADGATSSLGWGAEGWLDHPRAPVAGAAGSDPAVRAAPPPLVWTGRRLVTTVGRGAQIASLDPRARAWVKHPGPALGGSRAGTLLYTGRQLFAFGAARIAVLGGE